MSKVPFWACPAAATSWWTQSRFPVCRGKLWAAFASSPHHGNQPMFFKWFKTKNRFCLDNFYGLGELFVLPCWSMIIFLSLDSSCNMNISPCWTVVFSAKIFPAFSENSEDSNGEGMTINVEYNQLDPLLKSTPTGGDVADSSGFSPYPGRVQVHCETIVIKHWQLETGHLREKFRNIISKLQYYKWLVIVPWLNTRWMQMVVLDVWERWRKVGENWYFHNEESRRRKNHGPWLKTLATSTYNVREATTPT